MCLSLDSRSGFWHLPENGDARAGADTGGAGFDHGEGLGVAADAARGLDAFIEGMTLHFVTDRAPLSKAAIRMMVGQLAGERAQEEGR